jgi:hypothetical protein
MKNLRSIQLLLILIFLNASQLLGQNKIEEIRKTYNTISSQIENKELAYHEMILNEVIPGTGEKTTHIKFYYKEMYNEDGNSSHSLSKVIVTYNVAASIDFYLEYVFNQNQKLIFHYSKATGYECIESRYYFSNEDLIKMVSQNPKSGCIDEDYTKVDSSLTENFGDLYLKQSKAAKLKAKGYLNIFSTIKKID